MKIGAQLYTVRKHCSTLPDFAETLKKIADIGYRVVQVSAVCDFEPEWLKEQLHTNGLTCVVTHQSKDRLVGDTQNVVQNHAIFGCKNIGLGVWEFQGNLQESLQEYLNTFRPVAEVMKANGVQFMHHNHAAEFQKIGNKTILEHLCEAFSPEELAIILDTYWVQVAGGDPAQWLQILSGRVPCIHLKDCAFGQKMAVLGDGNINFDRVFEKAEAAGTQYMLVEQDNCYGEDPFTCLKQSYDYLKARGFE